MKRYRDLKSFFTEVTLYDFVAVCDNYDRRDAMNFEDNWSHPDFGLSLYFEKIANEGLVRELNGLNFPGSNASNTEDWFTGEVHNPDGAFIKSRKKMLQLFFQKLFRQNPTLWKNHRTVNFFKVNSSARKCLCLPHLPKFICGSASLIYLLVSLTDILEYYLIILLSSAKLYKSCTLYAVMMLSLRRIKYQWNHFIYAINIRSTWRRVMTGRDTILRVIL